MNLKFFLRVLLVIQFLLCINILTYAQSGNPVPFRYYPFNGNTNDVIGGYNGTLYGTTYLYEQGIDGQSIRFNNTDPDDYAVNDYMQLPVITLNNFSVSSWVRFLDNPNPTFEGAIFSIGDAMRDTAFIIDVFPDGNIRTRIGSQFGATGIVWYASQKYDINDLIWHHVAVTVGNSNIKLYIDGSMISSAGLPFDPFFKNARNALSLNEWDGNNRSNFNGNVDELKIFNYVLSEQDINTIISGGQTPYNGIPFAVPGRIQVEEFDYGGEGIAYHDNDTSNNGNGPRQDEGVDIHPPYSDDNTPIIGWFRDGEWMEYTVNVSQSGTYNFHARAATPLTGKQLKVYINDQLLGTMDITQTSTTSNDWSVYETFTLEGISLTAGNNQVVKLENVDGDYNFNWVEFESASPVPVITSNLTANGSAGQGFTYQIAATNSPASFNATGLPDGLTVNTSTGLISGNPSVTGTYPVAISATNASGTGEETLTINISENPMEQTPYNGIPFAVPGRIQVEEFDYGGEGIAYHDNDTSNNGNGPRQDEGVDIHPPYSDDNTPIIGWFRDGEWMEYTVNVSQSGTYNFHARAATPLTGKQLKVYINDQLLGTMDITQTSTTSNDWSVYETFTLEGISLTAGNNQVVKLENVDGDYDFNWVEFEYVYPLPVITSSLNRSVLAGENFYYQVTATNTPTSFNANGLPAGLTINTSTGVISGTVAVTGTYTVTLHATNDEGTGTAGLRINVYDQYKPKIIVLTDVGVDPDDEQSLVRFLTYANEFDILGIIGTTSCWNWKAIQMNRITEIIQKYGLIRNNLLLHADGYPAEADLHNIVFEGQPFVEGEKGMDLVGDGKSTDGSNFIIAQVDNNDGPVWISVWGGANTLAQALWDIQVSRTPSEIDEFISKIRVIEACGQDEPYIPGFVLCSWQGNIQGCISMVRWHTGT